MLDATDKLGVARNYNMPTLRYMGKKINSILPNGFGIGDELTRNGFRL
jgi:hypothetical protein